MTESLQISDKSEGSVQKYKEIPANEWALRELFSDSLYLPDKVWVAVIRQKLMEAQGQRKKWESEYLLIH